MAITISQTLPQLQARSTSRNSAGGPGEAPQEKTLVERIVDNTYLSANYTASGLSGAVAGLGAFGRTAPLEAVKTTGSALKNLWKTEMIGPNLKTIALLAAAPVVLAGSALALPFALGAGLWHGASQVDSSQPRQFTIAEAASQGHTKTNNQLRSAFEGCQQALEELGNEKLGEGEKPLDIPLFKTLKATAVGVAGAVVGAAAGIASAVVAAASETLTGIASAVCDERLGLGGKLVGAGSAILGGAVHGVTYGAGTALSTCGRSVAQTWKEDSLFSGLGKVFTEAGTSVGAALLPGPVLLQDKPQPPQAD